MSKKFLSKLGCMLLTATVSLSFAGKVSANLGNYYSCIQILNDDNYRINYSNSCEDYNFNELVKYFITQDDVKELKQILNSENVNNSITLRDYDSPKEFKNIACSINKDNDSFSNDFNVVSPLDFAFLCGSKDCLNLIISLGGTSYTGKNKDLVQYAITSGNLELLGLARRLSDNAPFTINDFYATCRMVYSGNINDRLETLNLVFDQVKDTLTQKDAEAALTLLALAEQNNAEKSKVSEGWEGNGSARLAVKDIAEQLIQRFELDHASSNFIAMTIVADKLDLPLENRFKMFLSDFASKNGKIELKNLAVEAIKNSYGMYSKFDGIRKVVDFIKALTSSENATPKNTVSFGHTLSNVAQSGDLNLIKDLISIGAMVNEKCPYGGNALYYSVWRKDLEMSRYLLEQGADVHILCKGTYSPLYWASNQNNKPMIQLLLDHGANFEQDVILGNK